MASPAVRAVLRLVVPAALLVGALAACTPPPELNVNNAGDAADAAPGDGTCAIAGGGCTLRAAIQEANARSGADRITFALPGSGVRTIQLASALPILNDRDGGTTIDGTTQAGWAANTSGATITTKLTVQIRGTGSAGIDGIIAYSGGNVIRGLSLYNLRRAITFEGEAADGNRVVGSFVGTDAAANFAHGAYAAPASGVTISGGADANVIGGTAVADRNVLSGNAQAAVLVLEVGSDDNVVEGNLIGLSPGGGRKVPNTFGVDINRGGARNRVGGTSAAARNVISGNRGGAVELSHDEATTGNQVLGNHIGTDIAGRQVLSYTGNGGWGVQLQDHVVGNTISANVIGGNKNGGIQVNGGAHGNTFTGNWIGTSPQGDQLGNGGITPGGFGIYFDGAAHDNVVGPSNSIAYNLNSGVGLGPDVANDRNRITANAIWDNTGLGINIAPLNGVNPNDAGDADTGANEELNFPVLTSATRSAVVGTACAGCRVEVFESDPDNSTYGQGRRYLGAVTASGTGSFSYPSPSVAVGARVTATATDAVGNTSEFSQNRLITS